MSKLNPFENEVWVYKGESMGMGPWRKIWLNSCGKHMAGQTSAECETCMSGCYVNDWSLKITILLDKHFPKMRRRQRERKYARARKLYQK